MFDASERFALIFILSRGCTLESLKYASVAFREMLLSEGAVLSRV